MMPRISINGPVRLICQSVGFFSVGPTSIPSDDIRHKVDPLQLPEQLVFIYCIALFFSQCSFVLLVHELLLRHLKGRVVIIAATASLPVKISVLLSHFFVYSYSRY